MCQIVQIRKTYNKNHRPNLRNGRFPGSNGLTFSSEGVESSPYIREARKLTVKSPAITSQVAYEMVQLPI